MWSDRESELDLLNVQHLVAAVETTVRADHLLPVTVGVFGDWGSGKSTVMNLAREALDREEEILCVHFNGWLFEGYEDAKAAILGTILDKLDEEQGLGQDAKDLIGKLAKRVKWFRLAGYAGSAAMLMQGLPSEVALAAAGLQAAPGAAKKLFKEAPEGEDEVRRTIRDFERDFRDLLDKTGIGRVVVFIDDLDRCLPTTIMATLEAIRLFVFVPKMAFVIAADERLVRRAVRQHFPDVVEAAPEVSANYPSADVGREYLEKLIQVPVHVPPLARAEIATYVNLLFAQLHLDDGFAQCRQRVHERLATSVGTEVVFSLETAEEFIGSAPEEALARDLSLAAQVGDVLSASVRGNPRQTKRFLNALLLRLRMAEARGVEVDRRITAKLMLLEYFRPALFQALGLWQAAQGGEPAEIGRLEAWRRQQSGRAPPPDEDETSPAAAESPGEASETEDSEGAVELTDDLNEWAAEPWVRDWLDLEPPLSGVNLAPYFFFARERTGVVGQLVARLSPAAKSVLQRLMVGSSVSHNLAVKEAGELSVVEAGGVFEALMNHTSTASGMDKEDSALAGMLRFVAVRPELQGQLATHIKRLPVASIGAWAPPLLARALSDDRYGASRDAIFAKWKTGKGMLKKATELAEKKLRSEG